MIFENSEKLKKKHSNKQKRTEVNAVNVENITKNTYNNHMS